MSRRKRHRTTHYAGQARFDRLYDKREASDPTYRIGQRFKSAPIKRSRCKICIGQPHHPAWFPKEKTATA